MEIFEAFTGYLKACSGLTDVKIYPDIIPDDTIKKAIVYELISDTPEYDLQGEVDLKQPIYQFSCYGSTNLEAYSVYKQLRAAFKDYQGIMGDIYVQKICIVESFGKDYDPTTKRHSYKVDFEISYT